MEGWFGCDDALPLREREAADADTRARHIVRSAAALLRADVAVLVTQRRALLVTANGVAPDHVARDLADPLIALELGYRGQISVPLGQGGLRLGALAVLTRLPRRFLPAEVDLVRALAAQFEARTATALPVLH